MKKKVAVFTNHFYPENFKINDIVEELSKKYEVTVVTQIPNYPQGRYYEGYGLKLRRNDIYKDVKIKRLFSIPRGNNKFFLALNYMSFYLSSYIYSLRKRDFDEVFVYITSPIFVSKSALRVANKSNAKTYLYLLDLWPDNLFSMLKIKNSFIKKHLINYCSKIYAGMEKIFIGSKSFYSTLESYGVKNSSIEYLPQHETSFEYIRPQNISSCVNILFAGNVGDAQGLDLLIKVAIELKRRDSKCVHFNIVGEGRFKKQFISSVQDSKITEYFSFYPRVDRTKLLDFYELNSFGLVILQDDIVLNKHLPLKVQSYMSNGLPLLAIAQGETKDIINEAQAGIIIENYEIDKVVSQLLSLGKISNEELVQMSRNAHTYALENFPLSITMDKIVKELEKGEHVYE